MRAADVGARNIASDHPLRDLTVNLDRSFVGEKSPSGKKEEVERSIHRLPSYLAEPVFSIYLYLNVGCELTSCARRELFDAKKLQYLLGFKYI